MSRGFINLTGKESKWVIQLYYPRISFKRQFFIQFNICFRVFNTGMGFELFGFGLGICKEDPPYKKKDT